MPGMMIPPTIIHHTDQFWHQSTRVKDSAIFSGRKIANMTLACDRRANRKRAGVKASAFFIIQKWQRKRKVGTEWGQNDKATKKGYGYFSVTPCFDLVSPAGIEPATY